MAIYRTIQLSFWTDNKVVDDFTPEDKYFYLYLFTNPQTNLCGCYEVSLKTMSDQTGYTKDTIERLLSRFETIHKVIMYSKETKEVLLLNWHKYNWTKSPDFIKGLNNHINKVKCDRFKEILCNLRDGKTVDRPSKDGVETSVTVPVTNSNNIDKENIRIIIDYLNSVLGTSYTYKNKDTNSRINARLKEGFSIEDFKLIIEDKAKKWKSDPKMKMYLRPSTLFAPGHFEEYLNEAKMSSGSGSAKPKSDWDGLAARLDKETADNLGDLDNIDYGNFN